MRSILFVELLGGIGDLVIALPAIQALGRTYPAAAVHVLTGAPGGELLEHDPLVHRVAYADRDDARGSVAGYLARHAFDLVVSDSMHSGLPEVIEGSGAARTVTSLWRKPPPGQRVADRFVEILLSDGVIAPAAVAAPRLALTPAERDAAARSQGRLPRPIVYFCPETGTRVKRWPTSHFVALGRALRDRYGGTLLVSAGTDAAAAREIAAGIGEPACVWPLGPLRAFAAALERADLVVAVDTGAAHIAATLGTPTITLFGPTWHGRYGQPPPHRNRHGFDACPHRVIADFTLQTCWKRGCPFGDLPACMAAISPAEVLAAAAPVLDTASRAASSVTVVGAGP